MKLSEKQALFTKELCDLIQYGNSLPGYTLRFGALKDAAGHKPGGKHPEGLAADILISIDGIYTGDPKYYIPLGQYWKNKGQKFTWGGDFGAKNGGVGWDSNHFSYEECGR